MNLFVICFNSIGLTHFLLKSPTPLIMRNKGGLRALNNWNNRPIGWNIPLLITVNLTRRLGWTDATKTVKTIEKRSFLHRHHINHRPSETQRICCEIPGILTLWSWVSLRWWEEITPSWIWRVFGTLTSDFVNAVLPNLRSPHGNPKLTPMGEIYCFFTQFASALFKLLDALYHF